MSSTNFEKLIDRWVTDAPFREAVRVDVKIAVAESGVVLSDKEWEVVRSVDWSAGDEELSTTFKNFVI